MSTLLPTILKFTMPHNSNNSYIYLSLLLNEKGNCDKSRKCL